MAADLQSRNGNGIDVNWVVAADLQSRNGNGIASTGLRISRAARLANVLTRRQRDQRQLVRRSESQRALQALRAQGNSATYGQSRVKPAPTDSATNFP